MDKQKAIDQMNHIHKISMFITIFAVAGFFLCGMGVSASFILMEFWLKYGLVSNRKIECLVIIMEYILNRQM